MADDLTSAVAAIGAALGNGQRQAAGENRATVAQSDDEQDGRRGRLALPAKLPTDTALHLPAGLSFIAWQGVGVELCLIEYGVHWWLGDWWLHGERHYGELASQAAPTGYTGETVRKAAWVCERIPPSRRRAGLSFGHHDAAASLDPAVAERLLDRAEAEGLTVTKLRETARDARAIPATSTPANPPAAAEGASGAAEATETHAGCCRCCGRPFDPEGP